MTVAPAGLRYLRLHLELDVETLDKAAPVLVSVKRSLAGFFDAATGGASRDGWTLGQNPTEDDVAEALLQARKLGLESIAGIQLWEVAPGGKELSWPAQLKPTELAVLDADPAHLKFQSLEVTA